MFKATLILMLLCAAPLCASTAPYEVFAETGLGRLTRAPYVPLRVTVRRTELQPFAGRIVAQVQRNARRSFGGDDEESSYSVDFTMEAGRDQTLVLLNIPMTEDGFTGTVLLERAVGDGRYEQEASGQFDANAQSSQTIVVGFLSTARLEAINEFFMDFALIEIPFQTLSGDWKSLVAYDAVIVNSEQLSREQNDALVEYVAAGGVLIISPRTAASFNPGLPAGELLGVPSTSRSVQSKLGDFTFLFGELNPLLPGNSAASQLHNVYSGYAPTSRRARGGPPVVPKPEVPREEAALPEAPVAKLFRPKAEDAFERWPDAGRARPAEASSLISLTRVGAGLVVFLHVDVSRAPFTAEGDDRPSLAGANLLLSAVLAAKARGMGMNPTQVMAGANGRQLVDIAGHRIPGVAIMVTVTALYIFFAGVGVFLLARRLKRPELYPAGLVALGVLSVVGVFGFGSWFKSAGDRVTAVRIIVSDNQSGRAGTFTLGCAYVPSGGSYEFKHGRSAALTPAGLAYDAPRGMPRDLLTCKSKTTGGDITTAVSGLSQWQNVFFVAQEPVKRASLKFRAEGSEGALKLENLSEFDLRGCIVLVGVDSRAAGGQANWHYLPKLGSSSSADASATLSASTTQLSGTVGDLKQRLMADLGASSLEYRALMTLFRRGNDYGDSLSLIDIENQALIRAGLLPVPGEVLVISVLPPDALSVQSMGAPEDAEDIEQACIWCVRAAIGEK